VEKVERREEWRKREKQGEGRKRAEAKKQAAGKPPAPKPALPLSEELKERIFNEFEPYRHQETRP
jgi:hypothetical protein